MATQGIQLPIELQISNLQEIAKQLKQFTNTNIIADSSGGKKAISELDKILGRLDSISAKSKTAFTTQSNFTSVEKDVAQIELGLNRVRQDISKLTFKDLKIPDDVQGQIDALQGRINELNQSLLTFKGTQKEKLINNQSFLANLKVAEPSQAAKLLEKGYDDLYQAINRGMGKVNAELQLKAAAFKDAQDVITQNSSGKAAMTQWGALGFIQEAFKALPKDSSKKSEIQKLMETMMNYSAGDGKNGGEFASFKRGGIGQNSFLKALQAQFEFSPQQMNEINVRLKQQAEEMSKTAKTTVTDVLKRMGSDEELAKNILFGSSLNAEAVNKAKKEYEAQLAERDKLQAQYESAKTRSNAYKNVSDAFAGPNAEIANKAKEIAAALEKPTAALQRYQNALVKAIINNPALAQSFGSAASEIGVMTNAIEAGKAKLEQMDQTISKMQGVSNFINRYIGVYAIVRKVTQAIRSAFNNIKELDKSITNIAVVTNMSQEDLWGKIGEYTSMAQQYGVATKDVYTVSQLFYQQGLQTSQVMSLTTETLKMAKIAGMGYEQAANAMTVAVRAFRIEMSEAQQVTDTYSALAAKFAVSSAEIANAMEKTASSAANVGMSLQSTSAFMSVMIQTTRESAQNIGSALKSIISRYGEMKASPSTLLNVEGEEVAFNKVDTALKSVGISIKDASGQFRDFDDVIMELAQKWNSLDNNTQRYIATIMAGNRQQSRFIALVSNYDELNRAMSVANTAENASIVQVAKTMDSLESKTNQLKNAFSQLYLDLHLEEGLKGAYDWLTRIVTTIGKLGMLKGVIPTLMTVVNAGFGAKNLISTGIEKYKAKRTDLQAELDFNTEKAKAKLEEVIKKAETPRTIPVDAKVNTTELDMALAKTAMLEQKSTIVPTVSMMKESNPGLTSQGIYSKLQDALAKQQLSTPESRAAVLEGMGINRTNTANYDAIDSSLAKLGGAAETSATQVQNAGQSVATAASDASVAQQSEAVETKMNTAAKGEEAVASERVGQAKMREADASDIAAQSDRNEATSSDIAAEADRAEAAASQGVAQTNPATIGGLSMAGMANQLSLLSGSRIGENVFNSLLPGLFASGDVNSATKAKKWLASQGLPTDNAIAKQLRDLSQRSRQQQQPIQPTSGQDQNIDVQPSTEAKTHWYSKYLKTNPETGKPQLNEKGQLTLSAVSSAVRMIAPLITAAGAAIKDTSKDVFEQSKVVTGLGNGLSGAATGAQIGAAVGHPIIGAIAGFALTGLRSIFDGLNYTITERIATLKQEAKEASDESLKKQAKVIDISSTLDNLKNLKDLMYNSSEDMKAYQDAVASAADSYPELISAYDAAGNAIIDLTNAEAVLSNARLAGAQSAKKAALKELETSDKEMELLNNMRHNDSYDTIYSWMGKYSQGQIGSQSSERISGNLNKLNTWIKTNSETIGYKDIYELSGISNEKKFSDWSKEDISRVYDTLTSVMNKTQTKNNLLRTSADSAISLERFISNVNNDTKLSSGQTSQLETSKNYQGLFTQTLLNRNTEYADLNEWQNAINSNFDSVSAEVYSQFLAWYNKLSNGLKESFENLDFTEYRSAQEIITKFNIGTDLSEGFIEQFVQANQENRDRIIKTIYSDNGQGWNLNTQLTGLQQLSDRNAALDIAYSFKEFEDRPAKIISKYADYFTTQLISIDKLAQDGYTALADNRLTVLKDLSNVLGNIQDSRIQNDLFGTITSIDLSSYKSISDAYSAIEAYGKNNNKTTEIQPLLNQLKDAENKLIYNVNTVAEEMTSIVTNAAKDIDTILSTNKSGMSFDKAIEAFNILNASFDDIKNFDDVFSYDAALGKYVYNEKGLQHAIEQREKELSTSVEQLDKALRVYTDNIGFINAGTVQLTRSFDGLNTKNQKDIFADKKSLYAALESTNIINENDSADVKNVFQELVNGYITSTKDVNDRSVEGLIKFIEQAVLGASDAADAATAKLDNYYSNKKNQLYGTIDWGKLSLGTDYSGTNRQLMEFLAKELGILVEDLDDEGNKIGQHWIKGYQGTWKEVMDKYIDVTYTDEDAKRAAKAAIKGQIARSKSDQVSTAITEVLNGTGQLLSEATMALVQNRTDLTITDGIISAGDNFVNTTLDLYKNYSSNLLSLADKNASYSAILNKSFEQSNQLITTLSSGASMDFSTLSDTFTKFGLTLSDWYNANIRAWEGDLANAMKTDAFGNTRIINWEKFLQTTGINKNLTPEILGSFEYRNAYSSYVDGLITLDTQMRELIHKNYDNAFSSITEWKPINISELSNLTLFKSLAENDIIDAKALGKGQLVVKDAVAYAQNISDWFIELSSQDSQWLYEKMGWTPADLAKNWKNAQTVITQVQDTWTKLAENISSLDTDDISSLVENGDFDLADLTKTESIKGKDVKLFSEIGDIYALRLDAYRKYLIEVIAGEGVDESQLAPEQLSKINEAYHKAEQAIVNKINNLNWEKILNNTASMAERDAFIQGLQSSLASLGIAIGDYYDANGILNFNNLINSLENLGTDISNAILKNINTNIAETRDSALKAIDTAMSYGITGTKNFADIENFVQSYNMLKPDATIDISAFGYDTNLKQFTLDGNILNQYIEAQKAVLESLGMSNEAINAYIKDQTTTLLQQEMDIASIFDDSNEVVQDEAISNLSAMVQKYLDLGNIVTTISSDKISDINAQIEREKAAIKISSAPSQKEWHQNRIQELIGQLREESSKSIVQILYDGGENAVHVLQQLKGDVLTSEEISTVYNASINRIKSAQEQLEAGVGTILKGLAANIALTSTGIETKTLPDGSEVITAVRDMVGVYANIYQQMSSINEHTTADLNNIYASLATELDKKNIDTRDTLTNAFDMSYESLAQLVNTYRPDLLLKDILNNSDNYGLELTGFGSINIKDFDSFAQTMHWEKNSPQFLKYYSQYVDDLIEANDASSVKALQEHAVENINAIAEAKPGSQVNVAYLSALFDQIDKSLLTKIMDSYGAALEDGVLTINTETNISKIIAAVQQVAAQTEALLPEQLAELSDTLVEFLTNITNLIKNGISGSLSNTEALDLSSWAKENGIDNLQFSQTAKGLQLTTDSLADVYNAMKQVDALQAKSLLPDIQSANSEYANLYSTLRSLESERQKTIKQSSSVADARESLQEVIKTAITQGTVETDFYLRPHIVDEDGFVETYFSVTGSNEEGVSVLVTPILPDGTKMSEDWAGAIAEQFANGEITLDTKLVGEDGKELQYTLRDIFMGMYDSVEAAEAAANAYHNYHQAVMQADSGTKGLNNTVSKTTTLMQDLIREMMVDPNQFNFMSNGLPDGIQSVVNAFENAAAGIDALTAANESGYMGVQDFYNIVTTASSLMEAAGEEFYVNGKTAAQLMEEAGNNLKVVDGKLTVDLSNAGLNLVGGGVDQLKANLKSGIDEIAKAQIEMLDAEIKVLEVLAAMEELGDIDVNGNGIAFEIDDMFETSTLPNGDKVRQFNSAMVNYLANLEEYATTHEEVQKALESIKIGNKSMFQLVQSKDWSKWQDAGFTEESLSQFLQTLTTMDWDVDNIQKQVADVLSGLSIGISVELENGLYVFSITGEQFSFNWDNKEAMDNAQAAIEKWWQGNNKPTREKIEELVQQYLNNKDENGNELSTNEKWKIHTTLALASGEITLKDEGNGQWSSRYKGKVFKGEKDAVIESIGQAMGYEDEGYDFDYNTETGKVTGKIVVGDSEIIIDDSGSTRKYKIGEISYDTYEEAMAALASQGEARSQDAGKSFTTSDGETWNVYTDAETNLTYTVNHKNNTWVYEGQSFDSYDKLVNYLQFKTKAQDGKYTDENGLNVEFEDGLVNMRYDLETGEIIYTINDHDCKNEAAVEEYLKLLREPTHVINDDGTISYSLQGQQVQVKYNATIDQLEYTMTFADNSTVIATNEESLKAAIATHVQPQGGETSTAGSNISYIYTTSAGVKVVVEEGQVNVKTSTAGPEVLAETQTKLNAFMAENSASVTAKVDVNLDESVAVQKLEAIVTKSKEVDNSDPNIVVTAEDQATTTLNNIIEKLSQIHSKEISVHTTYTESGTPPVQAAGNLGLANAKGTLMGELGPELVVSNGRYFVAGQNGPEMIDLADDAIVFNHLQTKSLLEKGMSPGRGRAVTNERNAVAFATGNIKGGPAMASASAALAQLKTLRAMWQSLLDASMRDLAGKGGSGGGGGGDNKAFIKELERWYNWLQKIAQLEKDINYYEAERNRISSEWRANGYKYFEDQKKTIDALSQQLAIQKDLTLSQEEYFEKRRAELNSDKNPFSSLYSFNQDGQLLYKSGKFEELSNMVGTNRYNNPNMSAQEQYEYIIKNLGVDEKYFEYDASGNEIAADDYNAKIQKFWDEIDSQKEEMQSLHDSVEDGYVQLQELQKQQNDLLKEMRDNQMDLEQKIYDAVVDIRQRAIDELSDTKDAIQESNEKFIDGLSKALEKERSMYDNKQAEDDLDKLRRRRDILVRSGGSASEIASLNEQISEQEQSAYFDKQQEQIDLIQEASDKQIEKLEAEISLQTEILEYQKKHGLLWAEVTDIMGRSPEEIARYIAENDSSYWDKSPVSSAEALNQLLFQSEQWAAYREEGGTILVQVQSIAKQLETVYGKKEKPKTEELKTEEPQSEGQPPEEGVPEGEGQQGGKKKWKAIIPYEKADGTLASAEGIGIHDTSDQSAKNIAYSYAKKKIPSGIEPGKPNYIQMYSTGGYNYNTGLAMLHGTPSEPEAIFNAEQTKILRDNILSNKPDSLISLLKTYNDITHGLSSSTYSSIANQSSSLVIEKAEVNLKVDKLANDYDSRQAAATIMDEMLRIASKTKANNSVRR